MVRHNLILVGCCLLGLTLIASCSHCPETIIPASETPTSQSSTRTLTPSPTLEPPPIAIPAQTSTPTQQPSITTLVAVPTQPAEPPGCRQPDSDYTRIQINGWTINRRTYQMLEHAADLYNGQIDIIGAAITQGSYNDNGPASFGTHLGGGAVDISVIQLPEYIVLYDEIDPLITTLRIAGFAAWLREADEAYPGTGIHIHAIAIGDQELSYPAQEQLTGKSGYFRGYDGLPTSGTPGPDRHGGPIICSWMREAGYTDLRPLN